MLRELRTVLKGEDFLAGDPARGEFVAVAALTGVPALRPRDANVLPPVSFLPSPVLSVAFPRRPGPPAAYAARL